MSILRMTEEAYAARVKRPQRRVVGESDITLAEPRSRFATGRMRAGAMNKLESAYAMHLDALCHTGEVLWWRFEGIKLRLADSTFYTPDFAVMRSSGQLEMHETKGWLREDANVKLKVAANAYPFVFRLVRKGKRGLWDIREV